MADAEQKLLESLRKADKQVCDKLVTQITQIQKKYQEQMEIIGDLNASCAMISDIQHQLQDEQLQFKQSEKGQSALQILQQIYNFISKSDDLILEVQTELNKRDLISAPNTIQKYIDFLEEEKAIFKQLGQIDEIPAVQLSLKQLKELCQKLIQQTAELITQKVAMFIDDPGNQKISRFSEMMENIFEELQLNQIAFTTLKLFDPSQYQKLRRNLLRDLNEYFRKTVHNHLNNEIAKFQFIKYDKERLEQVFAEMELLNDSVFNKNKCYDINFAESLDGKKICKLKVSNQVLKSQHNATSLDVSIYLLFLYYVMFSCAIIQSMNQLFDTNQASSASKEQKNEQQEENDTDEQNLELNLDTSINQYDNFDMDNRSEIPDFVTQDYTFNYGKVHTVQEAVLAVLGGSIEAEDFFQVRSPDTKGVFRQTLTTLLENQPLSAVCILQAFYGIQQLSEQIATFHHDLWVVQDVFKKVCGFVQSLPIQRLEQLGVEIESQGKQCQSNIYKSGIVQISQYASLLLFNIGTNAIYYRRQLNFQEAFPKESDKLQQIIKAYILKEINSGINLCDYKLHCYEQQEKQQNSNIVQDNTVKFKKSAITQLQQNKKQLLAKKFKKEQEINAVFENLQNSYYQIPILMSNKSNHNVQSMFNMTHPYFSNPINIQLLRLYSNIINKSTNLISETTGQIKEAVKQKYLPLSTSLHLYLLTTVFNMIIPIQNNSSELLFTSHDNKATSPSDEEQKSVQMQQTTKQVLNDQIEQENKSEHNQIKLKISELLEKTLNQLQSELNTAIKKYIYDQLEYNCDWFDYLQQIRKILARNYTETDVSTQKGFQISNFNELIEKMQRPVDPAKSEYAMILSRILKQLGGNNTQAIVSQFQNSAFIFEIREKYKQFLYENLIKTIMVEFQEFRDIMKQCYNNKFNQIVNINVNDIIQMLQSQKQKFLSK